MRRGVFFAVYVDAAWVVTVSVAMPALLPLMVTGEVDPKLRLGRFEALLGDEVRIAVSVTLPVNPACGVTVMVDVLPLVAPAVTVTAVAATFRVGTAELATVILEVPVALKKFASPL